MKAFLLAAGLGTRLWPLTDIVPKCLVRVCGRPLLAYWLDLLLDAGIDEIIVNTHYLSEAVDDFIAAYPGSDSIRLVHESRLLGTGGSLLKQKKTLAKGTFLVAHADNLVDFDVAAFCRHHENRAEEVLLTMMTFDTDVPSSCGIVEEDDRGIVRGFYEKHPNPPGCRANGAIYMMEPEVLDVIESLNKDVVDLSTEVLPKLIGKIQTHCNDGYLRDIGTPPSLALAQEEFRSYMERSMAARQK